MNLYHKRFLSSFSSENVIGLFSRYNGAAKEITESWAMLEAAIKYVPGLDRHVAIVVGDGVSPRTGALLAYYTKADVVSVDPQFNMSHWHEHEAKQTAQGCPPQRLRLVADRIENVELDCGGKPCVVLWPHSHANMDNTKIVGFSERTDIAMPCCVPIPRSWMEMAHIVFDDYNVSSPKRTLHVWRKAKP